MIAYLKGQVVTHTQDGAILQVSGVGYEVIGNWLKSLTLDSEQIVWCYEYLENESVPRLIGCKSQRAREVFIELLGVNGVGPKMAGRIVDTMPIDKLLSAITSGDLTTLSSVKGLGKKTAQKIILELGKTLVADLGASENDSIVEALSTLRFTPQEIKAAIAATNLTGLSENQALSAVLKTLGGNK